MVYFPQSATVFQTYSSTGTIYLELVEEAFAASVEEEWDDDEHSTVDEDDKEDSFDSCIYSSCCGLMKFKMVS